MSMVCPYCHTHVVTSTRYEDGLLTWLAAGGICLIGYVSTEGLKSLYCLFFYHLDEKKNHLVILIIQKLNTFSWFLLCLLNLEM